jgi:hypothetical protein
MEMKKGFTDIEVSKLVKAVWNYKEEDEKQTQKLIENFKRNGQVENIQIRELDNGSYEVVNGNHRLDVMNELKMKKCHVFNYGKITLAEAQRIAIETNETRFQTNAFKLGELIKDMSETFSLDEMAKTMPFTEDEMNNMIDVLDFDWNTFEDDEEPLDLEKEDKFDNTISFKVSEDTYKNWIKLRERMKQLNGYDNESKVFEFAVIEALNIPYESLD